MSTPSTVDRRTAARRLGFGVLGVALLAGTPGRARTSSAQEPPICDATPDAAPIPGPNLYELLGPSLTVTYSTSSIVGEPHLTLADSSGQHTFAGDTIRSEETVLGRLVTVELEFVPDLKTELLSPLLPAVGQVAIAPEIVALAIYTTVRTTIAGPAGVEGAIHSYRVVEVTGAARSVVF